VSGSDPSLHGGIGDGWHVLTPSDGMHTYTPSTSTEAHPDVAAAVAAAAAAVGAVGSDGTVGSTSNSNSSHGGGLLGRFKQLRRSFSSHGQTSTASASGASGYSVSQSRWAQDTKSEAEGTICLWAAAEEVGIAVTVYHVYVYAYVMTESVSMYGMVAMSLTTALTMTVRDQYQHNHAAHLPLLRLPLLCHSIPCQLRILNVSHYISTYSDRYSCHYSHSLSSVPPISYLAYTNCRWFRASVATLVGPFALAASCRSSTPLSPPLLPLPLPLPLSLPRIQ
jgi:hypothetical protein